MSIDRVRARMWLARTNSCRAQRFWRFESGAVVYEGQGVAWGLACGDYTGRPMCR